MTVPIIEIIFPVISQYLRPILSPIIAITTHPSQDARRNTEVNIVIIVVVGF